MNLSSIIHTCSQHQPRLSMSRGFSVIFGSVILSLVVTACIGPIKPVPTQQSQEAAPPTETADAQKRVEPVSSEAPLSPQQTPLVPLPPIGMGQVTASQGREELPGKDEMPVLEAKPVLVVASRESYVVQNATSGTKTDTPIMETPLNIQVIPQQVLKDQQVISIDQALKNVSGVTTTKAVNGGFDQRFFLRGFETDTLFRNGFRMDGGDGGFGNGQQFANVERIEVLKGPAAILYGRVEPGGMINVITKQPLAAPYYALTQQFGSYALYRTSLDATGPLTKDDTLLYRFNMSYQNSGSFRDLVTDKNVFLAPVLKWNISPRTQATLEMEYQHANSSVDTQLLPFVNNQFVDLPHNRNLQERNPLETEHIFAGFNWSHQFNDDWSIKHQFAFKRKEFNQGVGYFVFNINPDHQVDRFLLSGHNTDDTYSTNLDLTGHFKTMGLEHTVLLGGDYYRFDNSGERFNGGFALPSSINYDNPVHPGTPAAIDPTSRFLLNTHTDNYGLYLQDQIKLPYHVHVMGGLRYQYVRSTNESAGADGVFTPGAPQTNDAVTPRVGLLWQPQQWLSLYSNYAESFGANPFGVSFGGIDSSGNVLPGKPLGPTSAQQWEVGAKTEFFNGRLRATLAYYNLTKQNVATADPAHPVECGGGPCSLAIGAVRSKGPELDIQGEILPGWNVIVSYTNQDVRITKSNDTAEAGSTFLVGNRMQFVPRNVGSVWTTYEVQQGDLKGLKLGGGVNGQDGSYDAANTFKSPGYVLVGLMTGYSYHIGTSKVTARLNVHNLLDKAYFTNATPYPASGFGYGTFSTPRTFLGSITIEY
ncbi:MAG: TonB-dependent siderophore receptor [Nitrospira sp.]|nr:TonB-dependent siderophore receptor [Nitrospira sp.]